MNNINNIRKGHQMVNNMTSKICVMVLTGILLLGSLPIYAEEFFDSEEIQTGNIEIPANEEGDALYNEELSETEYESVYNTLVDNQIEEKIPEEESIEADLSEEVIENIQLEIQEEPLYDIEPLYLSGEQEINKEENSEDGQKEISKNEDEENTTQDENAISGWNKSDGNWYYYDENGTLQTGLQEIEGNRYYFADDGVMQVGWLQLDGNWFYFASSGEMMTNWQKIESKWYYFAPDGIMQMGWQKLGGNWYYFASDGAMKTGWRKVDSNWYYFTSNGTMVTNWQKIDGNWYYFASSGEMQTGWRKLSGNWYYFVTSGSMQTGWRKLDGIWYYFSQNGKMMTNWRKIDGNWYYFASSGNMKTGWQKLGGNWYYFAPGGAMQTGWRKLDGSWYYFATNGSMQTGWKKIDNLWYHLQSNGKMTTGWLYLNNKWYYLKENGVMATGVMKINGTTYRFCADGSLSTNSELYDLQEKLYNLGYLAVKPDGVNGKWTTSAIKTYQAVHGINADGVISSALYIKIMNDTKAFVPISASSSYGDVVALQSALDLNRMVGAVDGYFGPQTGDAVRTVQRIFGLPQTGVADAKTMFYIYYYNDYIETDYNVQGYYSDSNWLIYIDSFRNRMKIYSGSIWNWKQVYSWECSTGASATPTTVGEFTANFKGYSFGDDSFTCYYFTSFNGPYYMHSTLYNSGTWQDQDSRLGLNISHGCVRLDTSNAQWIYNNIPLGTKVVVN